MSVDERLIERQFFERMQQCNIKPRDDLIPDMDGQTHRFATEHDKGGEKSGAYYIHNDGGAITFGVMDYRLHDGMQKFTFDYSVFSDDERREYARQQSNPQVRADTDKQRKEAERRKEEEKKRQKENQQRARDMALAEYRNASDESGIIFFLSGYMWDRFMMTDIPSIPDKRRFPERFKYPLFQRNYNPNRKEENRYPLKLCTKTIPGGCCKYGMLLVPMIDPTTNDFNTIIRVMDEPNAEGKYEKKIYPGTSIMGSAFILAPNDIEDATTLFVVEGFCTALALFIDLDGNFPVYSCGSCHNLLPVCTSLRAKYSKKKIILVGDNDKAGIENARKCKDAGVVDIIKMPETPGFDWFDVMEKGHL